MEWWNGQMQSFENGKAWSLKLIHRLISFSIYVLVYIFRVSQAEHLSLGAKRWIPHIPVFIKRKKKKDSYWLKIGVGEKGQE